MKNVDFNPDATKLNSSQKELINGSLLGDGSLAPRKNRKNARFQILRKIQDIEYLKWEFSFLKDFCKPEISTTSIRDKRTNKIYDRCSFSTVANEQFTTISKKWYVDGKKHVPKNLKLTPLCLGIWLLDDANIRFTSSKKAMQLTFATHCFDKKEVEILAKKLQNKFGGYFGLYKNCNGYCISCSTKPIIKILKYISSAIPKDIMPRKTNFFLFINQ